MNDDQSFPRDASRLPLRCPRPRPRPRRAVGGGCVPSAASLSMFRPRPGASLRKPSGEEGRGLRGRGREGPEVQEEALPGPPDPPPPRGGRDLRRCLHAVHGDALLRVVALCASQKHWNSAPSSSEHEKTYRADFIRMSCRIRLCPGRFECAPILFEEH